MVNSRKVIGNQAERQAQAYLEKQGLLFICKNFSCRQGEIDLIMLENNILVFIEVKYRKNNQFSDARESVGYTKQQRLLHTSLYFLQQYPEYSKHQARFDVILLTNIDNGLNIEWITDAFHA